MHNTPIWEIHYMEPRCSSFDGIPWNFFDAAQSITLRFTKNNILEFQPPCWHVINDFIKSLSLWCFKIYVKKPAVIRWLTILGQGLQPAPQTFFATRWRWEFILLAFPVGETSNWVLKNYDGATAKQERHNQTSQEFCSASQSLTSWGALASRSDLRIIVGEQLL